MNKVSTELSSKGLGKLGLRDDRVLVGQGKGALVVRLGCPRPPGVAPERGPGVEGAGSVS